MQSSLFILQVIIQFIATGRSADLHLAGRRLVVDISKVEDTSMYIVHGLLALAKADLVDW